MLPQHQWVSKLFGYDFAVEFQPGHLNIAVDALSHRDETDNRLNALSGPGFDLFAALCCELNDNADPHTLQDSVVTEWGAPWRVVDGLILHDAYVFIPAASTTLPAILDFAHSTGHEGF